MYHTGRVLYLSHRIPPVSRRMIRCRSAVGCNANVRLYRYAVGQRFGKHVDESVEDENGHLSQWTVLVYLNGGVAGGPSAGGEAAEVGVGVEEDPLRGGETVFYKVRWPCRQFVIGFIASPPPSDLFD